MIFWALGMLIAFLLMRHARCDTLFVRVWCLAWGGSAFGAIPFETYDWWHFSWTAGFVLTLTACLGVGTWLGGGRTRRNFLSATGQLSWNRQLSAQTHLRLAVFCLVPSYLSVHLLLDDLGQNYTVFVSVEQLIASAAAASVARYHDDFSPGVWTRIFTSFVFLSGYISGWYMSRPDARRVWWIVALSFLPALAWTILLTTKANVLLWMVFAASGFLTYRARDTISTRVGGRPLLWALGVVVVAAMMFGVQIARYGGDFEEEAGHVVGGLLVAAVGHTFALQDWFDRSATWLPFTWGSSSFAGVFEVLGYGQRELGLYADQDVAVGESFTNVYSALRNLVEDLGILPSCFLFLILGWWTPYLERSARAGPRAWLAVLLAWVLWSPFTSMFNYNSLIFASVALVGIAYALKPPRAPGRP
jgi:oligosaccharide repeat unit polymerase